MTMVSMIDSLAVLPTVIVSACQSVFVFHCLFFLFLLKKNKHNLPIINHLLKEST